MKKEKYLTLAFSIGGIIFLLLLWEISSKVYASPLIFPGPIAVFESFLNLVITPRFYTALWNSFLRVLGSIVIAIPLGIIAGIAAGLDKRTAAFLKPLFSVISATPVISVILIAFLLFGSGNTPVFTALLMIFPVLSANVIEGIQSTDNKKKELFTSFRMSPFEFIRYLYLPSLLPFILGAIRSSLSLCWKVVVAAEVIVQPLRSLGTGMQTARAQLESPDLFAWTAATVLAASLSQALFSIIIKLWLNPNGKIKIK